MQQPVSTAELRKKLENAKRTLRDVTTAIDAAEQFLSIYESAAKLFAGEQLPGVVATNGPIAARGESTAGTTSGPEWRKNILRFLAEGKKLSTGELWQLFVKNNLAQGDHTSATFRTTLFTLEKRKKLIVRVVDDQGRKVWSLK